MKEKGKAVPMPLPQQTFVCDVPGCGQQSVVADGYKEGLKHLCFYHHDKGWCSCLTWDKTCKLPKQKEV